MDGLFESLRSAIDEKRKNAEHGDRVLSVELRSAGVKKASRIRTTYWTIDSIFATNRPAAELHAAVMNAAGVTKRYWWYDLPADPKRGEWIFERIDD